MFAQCYDHCVHHSADAGHVLSSVPPGGDGDPVLETYGDALAGRNWVERADGTRENLGATGSAQMQPGDSFVILTPGGGGFGEVSE